MKSKKVKLLGFGMLLTFLISGLLGCQKDEEAIKKNILNEMESRYHVEFEIVDFNYNKTHRCYEAGVQTENTRNSRATEVDFYLKEGTFDNYYANLYCTEAAQKFENYVGFSGTQFVYSEYLLSMRSPQEEMTYEDLVQFFDLENQIIIVHAFFDEQTESLENVKERVYHAASNMKNPNMDVYVYLLQKEEVEDVKDFVRSHYNVYADDGAEEYEYVCKINKRDGIVNSIE